MRRCAAFLGEKDYSESLTMCILCRVNSRPCVSHSPTLCEHAVVLNGYADRSNRFLFQPSPEKAWPDSWKAHIWDKAQRWRYIEREGEGRRRAGRASERAGRRGEGGGRAMWLMLVNSIQPCPGTAARGSARRREISGARATHRPRQKVDTHICIQAHTHTHTCRSTQTTNR